MKITREREYDKKEDVLKIRKMIRSRRISRKERENQEKEEV